MHTKIRFIQFIRTYWYIVVWLACTLIKLYSLTRNIQTIGQVMQDTGAYYGAGYALNHGVSPYDFARWQPLLPDISTAPYIYPPFWAVLWRIPASLDWALVRWGMTVLNLVIFGLSIVLLRRHFALTRLQFGILMLSFLVSVPVFGVFFLGQVGLLLGLLIIIAVLFAPVHPFWAGFSIGIASGIKLFPIIMVWPLDRTWRHSGRWGVVAGFGATILVGLIGAPLTIWQDYLQVGLIPDAGPPRWSMNRSGIWNVLDRTFADHAYKFDQHEQFFAALWPLPNLITPLAILVSGILLVTTWLVVRRTSNRWLASGAVLTLLLIVMPFQSNHYLVLALLPIAVLLGDARNWPGLVVLCICDTAVRYQYNTTLLVHSTWPADFGLVGLLVLWWLCIRSMTQIVDKNNTANSAT